MVACGPLRGHVLSQRCADRLVLVLWSGHAAFERLGHRWTPRRVTVFKGKGQRGSGILSKISTELLWPWGKAVEGGER